MAWACRDLWWSPERKLVYTIPTGNAMGSSLYPQLLPSAVVQAHQRPEGSALCILCAAPEVCYLTSIGKKGIWTRAIISPSEERCENPWRDAHILQWRVDEMSCPKLTPTLSLLMVVLLCLGVLDLGPKGNSATLVGCLLNRITSHLCWRLWKMALFLPVYCLSDSFFMCIYSADTSGEIKLMLNLYVNFNIEAILYLKNKINPSISFLTWYCILSLLENKIISECVLSKLQFYWMCNSEASFFSLPYNNQLNKVF